MSAFSLPTQRCFSAVRMQCQRDRLFSAYAEVFPSTSRVRLKPASFLCLRRGVSESERIIFAAAWLFSAYAEVFLTSRNPLSRWTHFSLPTQRCFSLEISPPVLCRLFSAYAEVFLLRA